MSKKKGFIYLGLSMLAFSTMEVAGKFISNNMHPMQINFLRFLIGGFTLLPFSAMQLKKSHFKVHKEDVLAAAAFGVLLVPISMTLFQYSIFYTKASITAVLISCNAIFAAPLSYIILKEKMDRYIIISLVSGILGIIIIASPNSSMGANDLTGIILAAASSITFALFSVLGKKIIPRIGGLTLNTISFISGSIVMIPLLLFLGIPLFDGISRFNTPYIIYIGVVVTAVAYIYMFKGFALLPVNAGSLVFFVKPVLAGVLSYLLLKETFSVNFILGSAFIMSGILFIVMRKQ